MKKPMIAILALAMMLPFSGSYAQKKKNTKSSEEKVDSLKNVGLSGLRFRSIGPALTGGRVVDLAINPNDPSEYFVASGHGSLWKISNHGTTFSPAFDGQKSFSIGAVEYAPSNPHTVWVGTGRTQ